MDTELQRERSWPMRLWLATPDWAFRAAGVLFFSAYVAVNARKYLTKPFWELGPYYEFADGRAIRMPWVPVLVDLTFVLIVLGFCLRLRPLSRVTNGWIVAFTLFTAFGPLLPIWLSPLLGLWDEYWQFFPIGLLPPQRLWGGSWQSAYDQFLWRDPLSLTEVLAGGSLITVGILLEVWGYIVLTRSFGIVPEARELKTSGPYRFVRHPVYLGQFLAQAGVWLFFAQLHIVWIAFYVVFVGLQLYRSKLEDRVLAEAFGDDYRQWRARTFWFV